MTIQEAIKSKQPFTRAFHDLIMVKNNLLVHYPHGEIYSIDNFDLIDILADDWEVIKP